jgi:hypothetical protein
LHSFRFTVAKGSCRGCKDFKISECWHEIRDRDSWAWRSYFPFGYFREEETKMVSGDPEESQGERWRAQGLFKESRAPNRLRSYLAMVTSITDTQLETFAQAVNQQVWQDAMLEEYDSIMRNDVWEVVLRPVGKLVVTSIWLYKTKYVADGDIEKHKA